MSRKRRIAVVGAGPAGIMAALEAAQGPAQVWLYDTNAMVGRKLLVTGNGRCNISNAQASAESYVCADTGFLEMAFGRYGHPQTIARLQELGILTYATSDGWCYPLSESAATVAATLAAQLELAGVHVRLKNKIADIAVDSDGVTLTIGGPSHLERYDRVVVAPGGKAYPALGSQGKLLPILQRLGHTIVPVWPALVPIIAEVKRLHKLQGVRLDVELSLLEKGCILGRTVGNLMFTQYGFSGPAAMDLSHLVSTRPTAALSLSIDLLSHHREELLALLARMRRRPIPLRVVLGSVLPAKLPPVLIRLADLPADVRVSDLSKGQLDRLIHLMTHLTATVKGTRSFKFAQVSTGGIPVDEVDPRTMASRVLPGVFFAGEVLDVVGPCGGYNLQFALTTGALAGRGSRG